MKRWWNARSSVEKIGVGCGLAVVAAFVLVVAAAVGIAVVASLSGATTTAAPTEAATVATEATTTTTTTTAEAPNTVGLRGDIARDLLKEAGYSVEWATEDGTAVFSPGNWVVIGQEIVGDVAHLTAERPAPSTTSATPTTTVPPWAAFTLSGSGDDVVDLAVPSDNPAILHIVHKGTRNFTVTSYSASGQYLDLLVNTIGAYDGRVPINFFVGDEAASLEVGARGSWTIEVLPLRDGTSMADSMSGSGDDVLLLLPTSSGRLRATHGGRGNFAVVAIGASGSLLINEIGGYEGTVRLPAGTVALVVTADGPWTLETS